MVTPLVLMMLLQQSPVVTVPAGRFAPQYGLEKGQVDLPSPAFRIDAHLVTQGAFAAFLSEHPEWQRQRVARALADPRYAEALTLADADAYREAPMVWVSWFAAQAFCRARQGRLPSTLEWERVAAADENRFDASSDPRFVQRILGWYEKPFQRSDLLTPGSPENRYGVAQAHGLVWEWTSDFNAFFVTQDNRQDGDTPIAMFCGSGSLNSARREDYAAFMRYALRSSLQARNVLGNLGFRCAYDVKGVTP